MTANAMKGDRELCLAAGMDDYIAKPVHARELYAAIEKFAPPSNKPVFRAGEFRDSMGDDEALMARLIEVFGEDSQSLLETAASALANGHHEPLERAAHSLKGMLGNYCSPAANVTAAEFNRIARRGDFMSAGPALERLRQDIARLRVELERFRGTFQVADHMAGK